MFQFSRLSRRATLAVVLGVTTVSAAGAATFHRFATTGATGSGGAQTVLQSSASGSAFQGEVSSTSANTGIKLPFGVLGEYDPSGSSFGIGTLGVSTTGYAIAGESLSSTQPSIIAYPGGTGIGLEALAASGSSSPAIYAQSNGQGDGIDGAANNPHANSGVLGEDLNNPGTLTDGVLGTTISGGYGVEGTSSDNALGGVHGSATTGFGVQGDSATGQAGVYGLNTTTPTASSTEAPQYEYAGMIASSSIGDGIDADSNIGSGLVAYSGSRNGAFIYSSGTSASAGDGAALALQSNAGGLLMIAYSRTGCGNNTSGGGFSECMQLDANGNFAVNGSIMDKSGTFSRTRNPNSDLVSYGDQVTEPTIEDVGRAQLVNGLATVPLAADYRQTIDNPDYLVFLTPHGDSKGLYVASESATGFVVRESQGGRSTLAFDYRIVAQQYGAHEGRLPHFASLHPNESRLQHMASRLRMPPPADAAARSHVAMLSAKKQQAAKRAHDRPRFVPPPVLMPLPASLSAH